MSINGVVLRLGQTIGSPLMKENMSPQKAWLSPNYKVLRAL